MGELVLRNVTKTYGEGPQVIQGIDLHIPDGQFTVFVGPSGCGKSTMLRMIAGLESVTGGDILIDGVRVNDLQPTDRGISMVFQSYALYPHMTVAENTGFSLKLSGKSKKEVREAVGRVAEILQITHLLERKPKALSGGQRQRVAIGRAIVRKPRVFLFDEPLSNLDAALRVQMRIELAKLHRELGTTMIYVTHDQVEAMTLGQQIVVFNKGRIEQTGAPLDLYERPANRFVGGFIGSPQMNMLTATLVSRSDAQTVVALAGASQRIVLPGRLVQPVSGELTLGVRAEHLGIGSLDEGLAARVELVEHLGDVSILHARLDGMAHAIALKLDKKDAQHAVGARVGIKVASSSVTLFDANGAAVSLARPEVGQDVGAVV
ncbi:MULTISPECIES: ABC transporter ATP-binding protein [unclassified Paraburkholderia]|uniref:ABC transporter ATP-binding protein n=1 Tax=unclassified Paraburkholderia TaxID=2615204 RepID=UPI00160BEB66|nr:MULTISPECIES: sn-glycerol-3-phosphate ABC transporter ATP-binding protein UgpC [unclassified Paraburkholderia]MBB5444825.1 multiple sugar transport system ATP-binding protein [Paraburkholderia sp. WSM4177]MBB5483757.1 multiple sugar transport system ATP-binding protein [Paraburkholderia sp. WSM4180]